MKTIEEINEIVDNRRMSALGSIKSLKLLTPEIEEELGNKISGEVAYIPEHIGCSLLDSCSIIPGEVTMEEPDNVIDSSFLNTKDYNCFMKGIAKDLQDDED